VRSSICHSEANLPQPAALEATAVNIPTETENYNWRCVFDLARALTTPHQYNQRFIFDGDNNAKHQGRNSRLINTKGSILYDHSLQKF
jgi:hypothetical protein